MRPVRPSALKAIYKKELLNYFATPLAYIFLSVFTVLAGFVSFELGSFFRREQADLVAFFSFHPWLYLILIPPLAMRLWAEERQSGTLELLMTLPVTTLDVVLAKFLAAWTFVAMALLLTMPMWVTVNYLGSPDNGIIVAAYVGSWLISGAFLALGSVMSAFTRNQIVAFVLTFVCGLLLLLLGFTPVVVAMNKFLPEVVVDALVSMSLLTHYQAIARGVLDVRDLGFLILFTLSGLAATAVVLDWKKAE